MDNDNQCECYIDSHHGTPIVCITYLDLQGRGINKYGIDERKKSLFRNSYWNS